MITDRELNEVSLSPTKKDYYQIWNEIIDLASKISDRWSPASTNESDPGIVLLKAAVAIADKLNYNIDKNTLEAFMPSATQMDSMRKLTEMMGYSMKYYRAATCEVSINYKDSNETTLETIGQIYFPKFVNIKNEEEDVNYVTLEDFTLQPTEPTRKVTAVEGELIECESDNDNIISMIHIDDENRYILPEAAVAENAVFVYNVSDSSESELWKQTNNLNTELPNTKCFKFGFDSTVGLPYLQFPEDIAQLIEDGLRIRYIRTNGINGNISARTLSKLEPPALWGTAEDTNISSLAADNFSVSNISAATNGADPETLNAAYNNYKKTIGTFDTLVTCRDYMNKIYQLTVSDTDTTPLVSNIIVSDIRDDINRSTVLCSFNEYGISYSDVSLKSDNGKNAIEHFDLVLYPFKTVYGLGTKDEYVNSFIYNAENVGSIKYDLEGSKTIAHNFVSPENSEIACIKNYLRLKARIATVKKVTRTEEASILSNIYSALYENFNNRNVDFGEEIPYDSLVEVIENADARIKDVSLDEPILYTVLCTVGGEEYELLASDPSRELSKYDTIYNKLALRNILAGRIAAFEYMEDFKVSFDETVYGSGTDPQTSAERTYDPLYPGGVGSQTSGKYIESLKSHFDVDPNKVPSGSTLELKANEVIQFRMPNFRTSVTYPCYVNYFVHIEAISGTGNKIAIPATFEPLTTFMNDTRWSAFVNDDHIRPTMTWLKDIPTSGGGDAFTAANTKYGCLFTKDGAVYVKAAAYAPNTQYYAYIMTEETYASIYEYIQSLIINNIRLEGLFRSVGQDMSRDYGKYVNIVRMKFMKAPVFMGEIAGAQLSPYYVQQTHAESEQGINLDFTADGLGRDAVYDSIKKNSEYQLQSGDYLLINYTDSKTDANGTETKNIVNKYYGAGTIIKPNFDLVDSALYHSNHSYSKKDNFYFEDVPSCEGMFTLGTNDQICIREIVKIELDENGTYLYWELNSDNPEVLTNVFTFDEAYGNQANMAYTLKEGEHLYYTNSKKTDIAYYGAGTLIVRSAKTPKLTKKTTDGSVSEEDIMTYGLAAAIPWGNPYRLGDTDAKLTIIENQYISLTEGDELKYISNTASDSSTFGLALSNDWVEIKSATYKFAESEAFESLPQVVVEGISWYARSRLDFNLGPNTAQTLNENDSIDLILQNNGSVSKDTRTTYTLRPLLKGSPAKIAPLTLFANALCQCAYDNIDVSGSTYIMKDEDRYKGFKIKVIQKESPVYNGGGGSEVNLDNYINSDTTFTKISFMDVPNKENTASNYAFTLNTNMLTSKYGLIMFYYKDDYSGVAGHVNAKIKAVGENSTPVSIYKFNTGSTPSTVTDTYVFTPGIHVLRIPNNCKQLVVFPDRDDSVSGEDLGNGFQSNLIFSDLSLIKGINKKLDYRYNSDNDDEEGLETLLSDILNTGIASDFFYNNPVEKSNTIELNENVADDLLSSPAAWYDTNNTNNKFVVSEIDADYLLTGITLNKSSRL